MLSEYFIASVFGVISPNVSSMNVIAPVAIAIAESWNNWRDSCVARALAATFIRLLPMRIVIRDSLGFSFKRSKYFELGLFSSYSCLAFSLLVLTMATSVPLKNADKTMAANSRVVVSGIFD